MIDSVLITGGNSGIGKECARQFALHSGVQKIYLGCRDPDRAIAAKSDLESVTGRSIYEIVHVDVSDLKSVRLAVESLPVPVDAIVMNAGGFFRDNADELTDDGVTQLIAVNVLGHVVFTEELLSVGKLTRVALYVGSASARGLKEMAVKPTNLQTHSVDEYATICDGTFFDGEKNFMQTYAAAKLLGALWISSLARQHSGIRCLTVCPGATSGTNIMGGNSSSELEGQMHSVEKGARRIVEALFDDSYRSGAFFASNSGMIGPVVEQGPIYPDLENTLFQDNANEALHRFIHKETAAP